MSSQTEKTFDCVEMKNQLQSAFERRYAGMTDDERREAMNRYLETSDDPVARKWRALASRDATVR